ncbi:MAG: hypothetical protein ACRDQT_05785 [Gaiellaceae bacterium]
MAALLAAMCMAASATSSSSRTGPATPFLVGVADDHAKWLARPDGLVAKYRDLGLDGVRVTIPWRLGQRKPTRLQGIYLHRAASLVARGQRVVLAVFGRPAQAPLDAAGRRQYCGFLEHVFTRVPFHDAVIWNEANSPTFWPRSAGPWAYEALLATCWPTLHALRQGNVNVISTTAARYDPAGFMREVGRAYAERKRRYPIVDTFGHNPYPNHAAEPPWVRNEDPRTVGQGDLDRYLQALTEAFAATRQPVPGEGRTTVWYLETGFQTTIARTKRRYYHGEETDRFVVPPVAAGDAEPWVRDQARQIRDALLLARCQPHVGAFFNFQLLDEDRLAGWQSGVLWRDGTHKASYDTFRDAVRLVESGRVDCSTVPGAGGPIPVGPPTAPAAPTE